MTRIAAADLAFFAEVLRMAYIGLWIVAAAMLLCIIAVGLFSLLEKEHRDGNEDAED